MCGVQYSPYIVLKYQTSGIDLSTRLYDEAGKIQNRRVQQVNIITLI